MRSVSNIILTVVALSGLAWGQGQGRGQVGGGRQETPPAPSGAQAVQSATRQAVPLEAKKLCKIEGRTVNARTGEPVPRVALNLVAAGPGAVGRSARSENDGAFLIEGIAPGSYRLIAERVGFLRQGYGSRTAGGQGAPLTLVESQHLKELEFRLTPQGVILGQVFDEEGDPLPRAGISAFPVGNSAAVTALGTRGGPSDAAGQPAGGSAQANDIGEFRIAGLSPGRYVVVATSQARMPARSAGGRAGAAAEEAALSPMPTYYPSSLDASSALPVEIAAGQDVAGINITIRQGQMYRISGRLMGAATQELTSVALSLMSRGDGFGVRGSSGARVNPDGTFEISRVRPGSYFLLAQRFNRGNAGLSAKTLVDVSASDVTGLVVPLNEPVNINGTVKLDGPQAATQLRPLLSLTSADGLPAGTQASRTSEAGAFSLNAVFPDRYYLNVSGMPEGSYVKSVKLAGQEVIEKGVDLTNFRGAASLDVTISPKAASLEGTVTIDEKPGIGAYVAVIPDPLRPEQPFRNRFATADQDGRFSVTGLAPGAYRVYAFHEPMPQLSRDPGLVKPYEQHSTKVDLNESATERIELKALAAGETR